MADPIGPFNDSHLRHVLGGQRSGWVTPIVAWGANAPTDRALRVLNIMAMRGVFPLCLGRNKDGSPKHPLYLRSDCPPVRY